MVTRGRRGMMLIEVLIAIAIFGIAALMCLHALATSVTHNRTTELSVAGTVASRQVIEEVLALAENSAAVEANANSQFGAFASKPRELINFLVSNNVPAEYYVDRIGWPYMTQIRCTYPINVPGVGMRDAEGKQVFLDKAGQVRQTNNPWGHDYATALAEVVIYLDETEVPATPGGTDFNSPMWIEDDGSPGRAGFDISGDGRITAGGILTNDTAPTFASSAITSIAYLPLDITIRHTAQIREGGTRDWQSSTYRVIVTDFTSFE